MVNSESQRAFNKGSRYKLWGLLLGAAGRALVIQQIKVTA